MQRPEEHLLDELSEELESACQAAERQALGDVNPNSVPQPAVVAPDASQVLYKTRRCRSYKLRVQIGNQQHTRGPVDNEADVVAPEIVPRPRKRTRRTGEVQKTADKDSRKARIARRAQVQQRFVKHREKLQKTGRWAGPRKFEAWLEWLAEREMDNVGEADAAAIPSVSCMPQVMCFSTMCVQLWQVYIAVVEAKLQKSTLKPEELQKTFADLRKAFKLPDMLGEGR